MPPCRSIRSDGPARGWLEAVARAAHNQIDLHVRSHVPAQSGLIGREFFVKTEGIAVEYFFQNTQFTGHGATQQDRRGTSFVSLPPDGPRVASGSSRVAVPRGMLAMGLMLFCLKGPVDPEQRGVSMHGGRGQALHVVQGDGRIDEESEQAGADQIPKATATKK